MTEEAQSLVEETKETVRQARLMEQKRWARRRAKELAMLVLTAYFAIWMHTLYISQCIQQSFLSDTRAAVCKVSFYPWSGGIEPGVQVSSRVPATEHH